MDHQHESDLTKENTPGKECGVVAHGFRSWINILVYQGQPPERHVQSLTFNTKEEKFGKKGMLYNLLI